MLLAFVSGLLDRSTRVLVDPLLEDAGKEKAMFRSLDVRIDDFFPVDEAGVFCTFFGVITVRGRIRAPRALVGVIRELMAHFFTHKDVG